jgi:hypothetical protein
MENDLRRNLDKDFFSEYFEPLKPIHYQNQLHVLEIYAGRAKLDWFFRKHPELFHSQHSFGPSHVFYHEISL